MSTDDLSIPLRNWRTSLFRGNQAVIDQFLKNIDEMLPPDWIRDVSCESPRAQPARIRCYKFDRAGDAAVRICLRRVTAGRVYGGLIQLLRHSPSGDVERIGKLITEFANRCVLAAESAGAYCRRPAFGLRSAVTPAVEILFAGLAETADGGWPFTDQTQALWDELISVCLAEQVAIDRDELRAWFEDSGWEHEAAVVLVEKFFADSDWLARRLAVMAP